MLYLDSVGQYIRYANIKVFCEPHFPAYGQNPRTYRKIRIREKPLNSHILPSLTYFRKFSPENYTSLDKNNRHYTENK